MVAVEAHTRDADLVAFLALRVLVDELLAYFVRLVHDREVRAPEERGQDRHRDERVVAAEELLRRAVRVAELQRVVADAVHLAGSARLGATLKHS